MDGGHRETIRAKYCKVLVHDLFRFRARAQQGHLNMAGSDLLDIFTADLIIPEIGPIEDITFTRDKASAGVVYIFVLDMGEIDEGPAQVRDRYQTIYEVQILGLDAEDRYRAKFE